MDFIGYKVEHYKANVDGSFNATADETDDMTGTTGAQTAATAKSYDGFTAQAITQTAIAGDGKTVVKVYYDRNSYDLKVSYTGPDDGTFVTPADHTEAVTYGGGYNVTVPTVAGYTPDAKTVTGTMDDTSGKTVIVTYTANTDTAYTVEHYQEQADGTYAIVSTDTEHLTGTTGATVNAAPKTYTGYALDPEATGYVASGVVTGDGKLVLKLLPWIPKQPAT